MPSQDDGPVNISEEYAKAKRVAVHEDVVQFLAHAKTGKLDAMKASVAANPKLVDEYDGGGRTALHHAAAKNQREVIAWLVSVGGDIYDRDHTDMTVLDIAIRQRHADLVQYLLSEFKFDCTYVSKRGKTVLHHAAEVCNTDLCVQFIRLGVPVDAGDRSPCGTWIHSLLGSFIGEDAPSADAAGALVRRVTSETKMNLNAGDDMLLTGLHLASLVGAAPVVSALVDAGASVNAMNRQGTTPLHMACDVGSLEIVKILASAPGALLVRDHEGVSPLDVAEMRKDTIPELFEYLNGLVTAGSTSVVDTLPWPELANELKEHGNSAFRDKSYDVALAFYGQAILWDSKNAILHGNASACHYSLGKFDRALAAAEKAVDADSTYAKGHYRKGMSLFRLNRLADAKESLTKAIELDGSNATFTAGLAEVEARLAQ